MLGRLIIALCLDLGQQIAKHIYKIKTDEFKGLKRNDYTEDKKVFGCIALLNLLIGIPFMIVVLIKYPSLITAGLFFLQILYLIFNKNNTIKSLIDIIYILLLLLVGFVHLV